MLVVCLMGPTASGKSLLAMALAKLIPVEIVSVDSAQVYRGMNLGTAKPSPSDRQTVPHHLLDLIEPTERYSAARFQSDAMRVIREIVARGRLPLLVGGTMLYFKALRDGLSPLPEADSEMREQIEREAKTRGWAALHEELARSDPAMAARIRPSDPQRIQRALEVLRITGTPPSELMRRPSEISTALRIINLALTPSDRAQLHARIATRFEAMLAAGLVEELHSLKTRHHLTADMPSMRCVGYRQAWQFLEGTIGRDELRDRGIYATRQLAKRQITWLRSTPDTQTFDLPGETNADAMAQTISTRIHRLASDIRLS